jgi:hypothetical protein
MKRKREKKKATQSQEERAQAEEKGEVVKGEERAQAEVWEQMLRMSTHPVSELRDSRRESQEGEEQAQEKITGRVTITMLPTMSSRLMTNLWISGKIKKRKPKAKRTSRTHWAIP